MLWFSFSVNVAVRLVTGSNEIIPFILLPDLTRPSIENTDPNGMGNLFHRLPFN